MPRSESVAHDYMIRLEDNFAREVYRSAALRQRGLICTCNIPPQFPYFDDALRDNESYGTLTEQQRDLIIDYLVKITPSS